MEKEPVDKKEEDADDESESIKKLRKWFETYDCEDTDEVIDRTLGNITIEPMGEEEIIIDMANFLNKYRK